MRRKSFLYETLIHSEIFMAAFTSSWCCDELREWLWIIKVFLYLPHSFLFHQPFFFFLLPAPPTHHHHSDIGREWIKKDINDGNEKNISLWFCLPISRAYHQNNGIFFFSRAGKFSHFSFFFSMESFYSFVIQKIFSYCCPCRDFHESALHTKSISKADTLIAFRHTWKK